MGKTGRKLGLLGVLLGGILSVSAVKAKAEEQFQPEPIIIASFEYKSNRPEPEYFGKTFRYDVWSDNTISQADKLGVKFSQRWFYDVDGDGNFGKAELDMLKSGKLVYMHPKFNNIANSELRNVLETMLKEAESKEAELREYYKQLPGRILNEEEKKRYQAETKLSEGMKEALELGEEKTDAEDELLRGTSKRKIEEKLIERKEKDYRGLSLLTQADSNFAFNTFGGAVGLRVAPFKNKNIGLGALLDFEFGLNKLVDSYSETFDNGKTFYGEINNRDVSSVGLLAELQYGPLFIGGGANLQNWIANTTEQILDSSGNILKSNENSVPSRQVFGKIYGGAEFPVSDAWKLGATVGYDGRNGAYFGLRNTFRLNKHKK